MYKIVHMQWQEENIRHPGADVSGSCELPDLGDGNQIGVLWNTEAPLRPTRYGLVGLRKN